MNPYQIKNGLYLLSFLFFYLWAYFAEMDLSVKFLCLGAITMCMAGLHNDSKEEESG